MIRGHQFNKVEMVQYTTEDGSDAAFEELVGKAGAAGQGLGLHYRLSKLAAGDCSASMARTYDIEVWIPAWGSTRRSAPLPMPGHTRPAGATSAYRGEDGKLHLVPYPSMPPAWPPAGCSRAGGAVSERRRLRNGAGSAAALPRGGCDPLKRGPPRRITDRSDEAKAAAGRPKEAPAALQTVYSSIISPHSIQKG